MNTILKSKSSIYLGFEVVYTLTALYECGYSGFNEKWTQTEVGSVVADDGRKFNCSFYKIGQLNKGNDVTVYKAQEEFDRDCTAFDICIDVSILKNGVELFRDTIINSDYSHEDKYTVDKCLDDLLLDYSDIESYIGEAQRVLTRLLN